MPRRRRPLGVTGLAAASLAAFLATCWSAPARAQSPEAGIDLLAPPADANSSAAQRFRRAKGAWDAPPSGRFSATSRIGAAPAYGSPPGFGAGTTGFDSSNTARQKKLAKPAAAGASAPAPADQTFEPVTSGAQVQPPPPAARAPQEPPEIHPRKAANRPGAALPLPPEPVPVSNPPSEVHPLSAANRTGAVLPIPSLLDFQPSAATPPPGTPPPNTLPLGIPAQRSLPIAAGDPYAPLGMRAGTFLLFPALDLSGGYDTNPQHTAGGTGSSFFVVAPELQVQSDWSRHSLTADIKTAYTEYGKDFTPSLDRPFLNGTIDGRIDVRHDTQILVENRFIVSSDNPGSPNLQAGLAKLPLYVGFGGMLGLAHTFNRLDVTVKGTFDRTVYDHSVLTDGEITSNADRDFNQYGGSLRVGYELNPGLKPFVELDGDERKHDELFDRNGLRRDSTGGSAKVGADVDLFGSLKGEIAVGYMERFYQDPSLPNIGGVIADGALIWQPTALTTARLTAVSSVSESVVFGTSGAFSRDVSVQVDHAFLPHIIGTLLAGCGRDAYVGLDRLDNRYYTSIGMTYKLNREVQIRGTVRQDWLTSTAATSAYQSTSYLLGVRLQR